MRPFETRFITVFLELVLLCNVKAGSFCTDPSEYECKDQGITKCVPKSNRSYTDKPLPIEKPPCAVACQENFSWCEERGSCIGKGEVCDCGPDKIYCISKDAYSCESRKGILQSNIFDICPDGSCQHVRNNCSASYTKVGCPKGEILCGQECKNKTEIVDFRPCGNKCVQSKEFCYFPVPIEPEPDSGPSVGYIIMTLAVVVLVAVSVGLLCYLYLIKERKSLLHLAVQASNEQLVRTLLAHGANPNTPGPDGLYPLHLAAKQGNDEITSLLLDHGAKVNIAGPDGLYPLHLAAKQGNSSITSLFLHHDANVDQHNNLKNTPLAIAAQWGKVEVARQLLDKGANVNNQMDTGWTPLHAAITQNHKDMVLLLCEQNADLTLRATSRRVDPSGAKMNPLELARKQGFNEIRDILQAQMDKIELGKAGNCGEWRDVGMDILNVELLA